MASIHHAAGCCLLVLLGCKSEAPPEPVPARTTPPASSATATAPAPKKPLLIQGIGADRPIVITVPSKMTLTMDDGEDTLPRARLRSGKLVVTVESPETGFHSLADEKSMLSRGAAQIAFEHDLEVGDGYDLIYRSTDRSDQTLFAALASRPELGATCHAHQLKDRAAAVRALSICATMKDARMRADAAAGAATATSADRTSAADR